MTPQKRLFILLLFLSILSFLSGQGVTKQKIALDLIETQVEGTKKSLKIEYLKKGTGPPLILLHGFGATVYTWRNNIDALSRSFTVYAYNHLGAGQSNNPFEKYDQKAYTRQLQYFINHLQIKNPILVGNSMGCQIALSFAGNHPDRVAGFVLIDPSGGSDASDIFQTSAKAIYNKTYKKYGPETVDFIRNILLEIYADDSRVDEALIQNYAKRWETRATRSAVRKSAVDFRFGGPQYYYRTWRAYRQLTTGGKTAHHCLVIWGKEDPWFPVAGAEIYRKVLPGAEILLIDHAGHLPHAEAANQVNEAIIQFAEKKQGAIQYGTEDVDWFLRNLKSDDLYWLGYSAEVLGNLQVDLAVEPLAALIGHENKFVDYRAVEALLKIKTGILEPVLAALNSENALTRASAAVLLGKLDDRQATPALIEKINDPDVEVRKNVITALRTLKDPQAVEPLIGKLADNDGQYIQIYEFAGGALAAIGLPAIEPLIRELKNNNSKIRERVADVMARLKAVGFDSLAAAVQTDDANSRSWIVYTLGKFQDHRALPLFVDFLKDPDPDVRFSAIWGLGELRSERAVKPLLKALKDANKRNRRDAAIALGKTGVAAIPHLMQVVRADTGSAQRNAARALGYIQGPAIDSLLTLLPLDNENVRLAAAIGIGKSRYYRVVEPLIKAMNTENQAIRDSIAVALGTFSKTTAEVLIPALKDSSRNVRIGAVYALGAIGNKQAVAPLIETMASDRDTTVRFQSVVALRTLKDTSAIVPLIHRLQKDTHKEVREQAALTLGVFKAPRACAPLMTALNDPYEKVRLNAAWALGELKNRQAVPSLCDQLKKEKKGLVRAYIAGTLGKIMDPAAVPSLIEMLKDSHPETRQYAAWALGNIKDQRAIEPLVQSLTTEDNAFQTSIIAALKQITGRDLGNDPVKWQQWWNETGQSSEN